MPVPQSRPWPINAWYVAARSDEIADKPLGRRICGERVAFFRRADGNVAAVEDFCPHRGAPMSLGRVEGDHLVCPYHGLVMDGEGRTCSMPKQRVAAFPKARSYPVVERYGFVWLWPGDATRADPAAIPAFEWADNPAYAYGGGLYHIKADYRLMIDNLMDLTHETFVHGGSIGNDAVAEAPFEVTHGDTTVTVTRWMRGIEAPPFWAGQLQQPGPVDRWQIIHFQAPGTVNIDVGVAPAGTGAPEGDRSQGVNGYVLNTMTPETATTCHYFWAFARNYRRTEQRLTTEIREGVAGIFHEDEIILEAQQRAIDANPDRVFYNLNIDAGAMWARRMIDRMIARENPPAAMQAAE